MLASTHGVGISGSSARMVSVQVHRTKGARIHASGISWNAMRHCLARVFAAFETCGWQRPSGAITLHVGPEMHHASHHRCSLREVHSLKNIARTHALIKQWPECSNSSRPEIDMESIAFACQFRIFDRPNWWKNGQGTNWRNYPSEAIKPDKR